MAMRVASIDYETKTVTLEEDLISLGPGDAISVTLTADPFTGSVLREGMTIESDGVDVSGQLINPRRVK